MSRPLNFSRTLLATTALVAVAAGASAQTLTGASTTAVLTSATGLTPTFSSTAAWSVGTGPAVEISGTVGTPGAAVITAATGSVVSSSAITGTLAVQANTNLTGVTINNSGTIVNTNAAGVAISATATNAASAEINTVIRNTGTISGSTTNGSIQTGGGDDQVINTGGTIRGGLTLGAGANTITINGGSLTGNISTTTGIDTFTLSNSGTMTGNVELGAGANVATIDGSTLTGTFTTLGAADTLTLTNASVSGLIDLGLGTDIVNVSGTSFTTQAALAGVETLNVSATTATFGHSFGSAVTGLTVANGSTLTLNADQTATSAAITNSGTVSIAAGKTLSVNTANMAAGNLTIKVSDSTSAGKLVLATGGINNTSYTIDMSSAGYIASGTSFVIVDGGATSTLSGNNLTSTQSGVYVYNVSRTTGAAADSDISLTIGRVAAATLVNSEDGDAIAAVMDSISSSAVGSLATVQTLIGAQTTSAGVNSVIESLTPGLDGAGAAAVGVTQASGVQISNRLASLRSGVATGSSMATGGMWVEGFGAMSEQDDKNGTKGYEATGAGVTFGADTDTLVDGANVGAAFTYGHTTVDSAAAHNAQTDIDTYVATLYGSKVMDMGVFVNGQVGLGYNGMDMERTISGVGVAKADTNALQGTIKAEAGRDFAIDAFTLTPVLGAQYTYLDMDGYTETGVGNAGLTVKPDAMSAVDFSAGARAAYTVGLANGGTLRPNARLGVTTRAGDTNMATTSNFIGAPTSTFKTDGLKADRTSVNAGLGLLLGTAGGMDLSADYDADIRSSFTGHTAKLKARFAF